MDNLGHFASVNTNTVQVFCTEAEKIALLVTVQCYSGTFLTRCADLSSDVQTQRKEK